MCRVCVCWIARFGLQGLTLGIGPLPTRASAHVYVHHRVNHAFLVVVVTHVLATYGGFLHDLYHAFVWLVHDVGWHSDARHDVSQNVGLTGGLCVNGVLSKRIA
jgi:hypothetical protein